jgi:hypothetical protein
MQLCASGARKSAKELGTLRTCRVHYIQWCIATHLTNDILLINTSPTRRVLQMMAYAVHICSSGTYHHKHVVLSTAKAYLAVAVTMISKSCRHDPRKYTASSPTYAPKIVAVFNKYKRLEAMLDHCEPWTPKTQLNLDAHLSSPTHASDSLPNAIADFTAAGLQVGYRVLEYAKSDPSHAHLDCHACNNLTHKALAFTLADIT